MEDKIIVIESREESLFSRKFIVGIVSVSFNELYTAFAADEKTAFVYNNSDPTILDILSDASVTKLVLRPLISLETFFGPCKSVVHIFQQLQGVQEISYAAGVKGEILKQEGEPSLRAARVALIIMRSRKRQPEKTGDCEQDNLAYLTSFNKLLSRFGPLKFMDLIRKVKRLKLHPIIALEWLIKSNFLLCDPTTSIVRIP